MAMVARRAFQIVNGSASHVLVRPMIVMVARVLGPGPTRLRLVKLAHNLDAPPEVEQPSGDLDAAQGSADRQNRRAA